MRTVHYRCGRNRTVCTYKRALTSNLTPCTDFCRKSAADLKKCYKGHLGLICSYYDDVYETVLLPNRIALHACPPHVVVPSTDHGKAPYHGWYTTDDNAFWRTRSVKPQDTTTL
ncbi:unnamed protein product [Macrosiphum euphorbiae]|uniref:Uncharacterized protein n=1 Tax=Macrosiphum euphorbiae TaxID=13131 RepID=A0AAV0WIE7_9HEMI|nr:unnamed protein product [Macrosiphum euphorbiae]